MAAQFESDSGVMNHRIKQRKLLLEVDIVANATPADKGHGSDIPSVVVLRSEGKVADADAIEDLSGDFTAAVDNNAGNSQFGIVIDGDKLEGDIDKVYSVSIVEQTSLASSLTVAPASSDYKTAGGNIAIDITGTGLDLSSESPRFLVEVEYLLD